MQLDDVNYVHVPAGRYDEFCMIGFACQVLLVKTHLNFFK